MDEKDFEEILRIQQMTSQNLLRETQQDNKITLLSIISDLAGDSNQAIQVESILIEAQNQGLEEGNVVSLIDELKSDGLLNEEQPGFVRRI